MQIVGITFCGIIISVNLGFTSPEPDSGARPSSIRFDTILDMHSTSVGDCVDGTPTTSGAIQTQTGEGHEKHAV